MTLYFCTDRTRNVTKIISMCLFKCTREVHKFFFFVHCNFDDQNNRFDTLEMKLKRRKLRSFLSSRWLYLTYYSKQKAWCSFVAYFYKLIFFCQKHALNGWRLKFTCKIDLAWQWFRVVCLYNQNKRRRGDLKFWLKASIRRRFLNW